MIGPETARTTFTGERGDALFYFPEATPITSVTVSVSRSGYVTQTPVLAVQPGERSFGLVQLVRS